MGELLPSIEELLTRDGDDRIAIDARTGRNKYNCTPAPREGLVPLGSSTASTISAAGVAAAEDLRAELMSRFGPRMDRRALQLATERVTEALRKLLDLDDDIEIALTPSGTDSLRMGAALIGGATTREVVVHIVEPCETGRGVVTALSEGVGTRAAGFSCVSPRDRNGRLRTQGDVEEDFRIAIQATISSGRDALLVVTDVTKTGLVCPRPDFAKSLVASARGRVHVLVDACQARLASTAVRAYLGEGFPLALTGSKFWSGPTFSGALLAPGNCARAGSLRKPVSSVGVLLRWEAALAEARRFVALPAERVTGFLNRFRARVEAHPAFQDCLSLVELPELAQIRGASGPGWDAVPTIFPFVPVSRMGGVSRPLTPSDCLSIYRVLAGIEMSSPDAAPLSDHVELGQPVKVGEAPGGEIHALRLSASARLTADALSTPESEGEVLLALDNSIALIAETAHRISSPR